MQENHKSEHLPKAAGRPRERNPARTTPPAMALHSLRASQLSPALPAQSPCTRGEGAALALDVNRNLCSLHIPAQPARTSTNASLLEPCKPSSFQAARDPRAVQADGGGRDFEPFSQKPWGSQTACPRTLISSHIAGQGAVMTTVLGTNQTPAVARAGSRHQQTKHVLGAAHFQGRHSGHLSPPAPNSGGKSLELVLAAARGGSLGPLRLTPWGAVPHLVAGLGRLQVGWEPPHGAHRAACRCRRAAAPQHRSRGWAKCPESPRDCSRVARSSSSSRTIEGGALPCGACVPLSGAPLPLGLPCPGSSAPARVVPQLCPPGSRPILEVGALAGRTLG
ncbi:hypothetical protein KIL84_015506 [Mauremys mutica]|uniref:Uncharacterized protein n=1 Tax=Mauremys mutica TaxID=74926 RepID=A0A9D4APZ7_9SAUR|nr:hypothetical protein KIL84_015506 [Mauremys mutica]